jgi:hypothetical protein
LNQLRDRFRLRRIRKWLILILWGTFYGAIAGAIGQPILGVLVGLSLGSIGIWAAATEKQKKLSDLLDLGFGWLTCFGLLGMVVGTLGGPDGGAIGGAIGGLLLALFLVGF